MNECSVPTCHERRYATTSTCYDHWLARPRCSAEGCDHLVYRKSRDGRCQAHHVEKQTGPIVPCAFPSCDRRAIARGLCGPHAKQQRRGVALKPLRSKLYKPICGFGGCERPTGARGLCTTHYNAQRLGRELRPIPRDGRSARVGRARCRFEGCDRWARGLAGETATLCAGHYDQIRNGKELRPLFASSGRTSGHVNHNGYRIVSVAGRAILEHRLVMEGLLGRPLEPYENVHHVNGEKLDNRSENLELWVTKQPRGQRVSDLIQFVVHHYLPQVLEQLEQRR